MKHLGIRCGAENLKSKRIEMYFGIFRDVNIYIPCTENKVIQRHKI